jgi:hypothetical protein
MLGQLNRTPTNFIQETLHMLSEINFDGKSWLAARRNPKEVDEKGYMIATKINPSKDLLLILSRPTR